MKPLEAAKFLTKMKNKHNDCKIVHVSNIEAERLKEIIATDAEASIYFAENYVNGRWEQGEPAILASMSAWDYANILYHTGGYQDVLEFTRKLKVDNMRHIIDRIFKVNKIDYLAGYREFQKNTDGGTK